MKTRRLLAYSYYSFDFYFRLNPSASVHNCTIRIFNAIRSCEVRFEVSDPTSDGLRPPLGKSMVQPVSCMDTVVELVGSIKESFNRLVNRYVPQIQTIPLEQGMKFEPTWKTVPTHSLTQRRWNANPAPVWYDPAYTCTDSTGTLIPCWLAANPFPTLNRRSVLGIYQKDLVRGAISRTELLNISFATTCFEPFLGLLCLLVLIELENFLVRKAITPNSPQVGFEPTTSQLTADRSTTELLRNNGLKLRKPTLILWTPTYDRTKKGSSLFFTYTGIKGYDSKPLLGRRASRTRGRRSTIHSRGGGRKIEDEVGKPANPSPFIMSSYFIPCSINNTLLRSSPYQSSISAPYSNKYASKLQALKNLQ
ncbi:hypothetical protein DEO72_LG5g1771 [Vigna unguiculata]|uniref:Uncharacterized protein n=1 Tax=Vigna unguiculata TaxID=3917 RepID=A0A4D6LY72_VIGUN|nr:hypothetical protein DEO72_LG5g1771 [Vigna unguiculata]